MGYQRRVHGTHPIFESDFDCLTEMGLKEIGLALGVSSGLAFVLYRLFWQREDEEDSGDSNTDQDAQEIIRLLSEGEADLVKGDIEEGSRKIAEALAASGQGTEMLAEMSSALPPEWLGPIKDKCRQRGIETFTYLDDLSADELD